MNIDEDPKEALSREIMEELGIDIIVDRVVHMEQFMHVNEGKRAFVIVFEATLADVLQPIVMSELEVSEIAWVRQVELEQFPFILRK